MRRLRWTLLAAVPTVLLLGVAAFVFTRAQHTLDRAGMSVAQQGKLAFAMRPLAMAQNPGFEAIASPASYVSGAYDHGKLYVSGPGGLVVYSQDGVILKSYRVGIDLPAAPLGQVIVGRLRGGSEPELMIATSGAGVLLFAANGAPDGSGSFRQLWAESAGARDVTSLLLLPTGELLIGTKNDGLLTYTGKSLELFHSEFAGLAVTALAADATGFWVGTRNKGVRHWHGGQVDRFDHFETGKAESSLPDEQVDAIAVRGEKTYVGTPSGVEEFDGGRPARTLARNLFAHALFADDRLLTIGSIDEGIQQVSLDTTRRSGTGQVRIQAGAEESSDSDGGAAQWFLSAENEGGMLAVMHDGLRRRQADGAWAQWAQQGALAGVNSTAPRKAVLTDGNISSLAFDGDGRLWVGYFDRGLDVVSSDLQRARHLENDRIFCVNRIALDARRRTMAVATANGLVLMDEQGNSRQVMTKREGLIADHVTDVGFTQRGMVVATPAGLTFVDAGGAQSLYAFQGLVNNHVYALGVRPEGGDLLAGTLGGISLLRDEAVKRNLTVSNSGLKHNWVTAIVPVSNAEWMVGTYGAGVMLLGADGRFTAMDGGTRAMVVNPNAMLATDAHIFAGTLGEGLWVWSRAANRWRQITAGLPSENVTAIAEHDGEVYVGTESGLVRIAEKLLE